jgi:predicted nucleic acid-binding Zn ribbon protein
MTAKPRRKCPECGKLQAKRMIGTGAAVIFRGSGFYQTDYRSSSYKQGAEADKKARESSKKSPDSTSSKKTETKASSDSKS